MRAATASTRRCSSQRLILESDRGAPRSLGGKVLNLAGEHLLYCVYLQLGAADRRDQAFVNIGGKPRGTRKEKMLLQLQESKLKTWYYQAFKQVRPSTVRKWT